MTLAPGPRYVAARFSPVTLTLLRGKDDVGANRFGTVTVTPTRSGCSFEFGTTSPCDYAAGTLVTLRRQRAAPGFFWIGACDRNRGGRLDAAECTLRLRSNEVIGAGFATVKEIPPPLGSGVEVRLAGKGQGKVSGGVINGSKALTCQGVRCLITGLTRYDYIRLQVKTTGKNRFDRWSDGSHATNRVIGLMATNRLWAKFDKKR
jgi:hypothetical protein